LRGRQRSSDHRTGLHHAIATGTLPCGDRPASDDDIGIVSIWKLSGIRKRRGIRKLCCVRYLRGIRHLRDGVAEILTVGVRVAREDRAIANL
jgi:hypothetical protein